MWKRDTSRYPRARSIRNTADPEENLLGQAIPVIAAVELIGQAPVPEVIAGHVGIEQEHRHFAASGDALERVSPGAHPHRPPFDLD